MPEVLAISLSDPKTDMKKQANDYELISTAYHEASHAVCGLLYHMKVVEVSVIKDNTKYGITNYDLIDTGDTKDFSDKRLIKYFAHSEVAISYAGLIGEKIYYYDICGNKKFPMHLRIGSSSDFYEANRLINKYKLANPGKERQEYKKKIQAHIYKELKFYWTDIKLVAHLLYNKRKITFKDLKNTLTKKSINKTFWQEQFKKISTIHRRGLKYNEEFLRDFIINS